MGNNPQKDMETHMKKFKPQLAPNDKINLNEIQYPLLASTKLDGYRCIFYKGEMLTRSLKQVQNKQLREKYEALRKYSKEHNLMIDGEIYSHELTFQELNKFFMSEDLESARSIKRYGEVLTIPDHVKFYLFDCVVNDRFDEHFIDRNFICQEIAMDFTNDIVLVEQYKVESKEEVEANFDIVIEKGFEGLILKSLNGKYKCGRGTVKEGLIYKCKPFVTIDSKIIGVVQATEVDPNVEKKINELGCSVTSKRKQHRLLIEKASAFLVDYKGKELKVVIAMTDVEKEEIWKNKENYIGKFVEYKFMKVGMKEEGLPRHPTSIRMRYDKD